jgi:MFS family permease
MGENRQLKFFYGYIIVVAAFLLMAIMWGSLYVFGVFFEPLLAEHFGLGSLGAILGFLTFGLETGNGVGPVLVGYLVDISGSYQMALLACVLVSLLSIILILPLRPIRR